MEAFAEGLGPAGLDLVGPVASRAYVSRAFEQRSPWSLLRRDPSRRGVFTPPSAARFWRPKARDLVWSPGEGVSWILIA